MNTKYKSIIICIALSVLNLSISSEVEGYLDRLKEWSKEKYNTFFNKTKETAENLPSKLKSGATYVKEKTIDLTKRGYKVSKELVKEGYKKMAFTKLDSGDYIFFKKEFEKKQKEEKILYLYELDKKTETYTGRILSEKDVNVFGFFKDLLNYRNKHIDALFLLLSLNEETVKNKDINTSLNEKVEETTKIEPADEETKTKHEKIKMHYEKFKKVNEKIATTLIKEIGKEDKLTVIQKLLSKKNVTALELFIYLLF